MLKHKRKTKKHKRKNKKAQEKNTRKRERERERGDVAWLPAFAYLLTLHIVSGEPK
jgi:hypothetical protein